MKNKDKLIDAIGKIDDKYIDEAHNIKKKAFVFNWALVGKLLTGAVCLFLLASIIPFSIGMGSASKSEDAPSESFVYDENGLSYASTYDSTSAESENSILTDNKKLIVTGYINIETLDFDILVDKLSKNIVEAGGYIQNSSISINRNESRYYEAVIRIPAGKYDEFINKTKQTGNVTWYSENIDDITETYTDLNARLTSLKAEEEKVLEFYDKAENLQELITIESRLTDIRYEIDSIETRIKNYDTLVAYSTLNISVNETKAYTRSNDNFFSRLSLSFKNGITNFVNMVENLILDIAYNISTIIVVAVIVVFAIFIIKRIRKNRR